MDTSFARQYYESAAAQHWWFEGRRALIHALLERKGIRGGTFVDLGAGSDSLLPDHLAVIKLDIVQPRPSPDLFVQGSAEALPFRQGEFDGVGLFDILEHLDHPSICLSEARRVVRPGGLILITVPAYPRLWSPHDDLVGHKRRYTSRSLSCLIQGSGMRIEWISQFYGFLLPPALVRTALKVHSPMSLPPVAVNEFLSRVARRSARRALDSPSRLGLSVGALATVV